MRSEGFSFYILGVQGLTRVRMTLRLVSATLRNRPQPSTHNRRETKVAMSRGKPPKRVFLDVSEDVLMFFFAWQVWHFVTFDVFREECVCAAVVRLKLPCQWGKPQKRVFLDVSEDVIMSFAWQVWHFVTFDVFHEECVCAAVVRLKLPCL